MRFGRGAGTWASKTHPALSPINDCGTIFGVNVLFEHESMVHLFTTAEKRINYLSKKEANYIRNKDGRFQLQWD